MSSTRRLSIRAYLMTGAIAILLSACSRRPDMGPEELRTHCEKAVAANALIIGRAERAFTTSLQADLAAGRPPVIDILTLSGGADWGAFGTGFLRAWAELPAGDARAMPAFDLVTGISTGALIAPYAGLGRFVEIDDLFRNSKADWATSRFITSLMSGQSLYDISELEDAIFANLDRNIIPDLTGPHAARHPMVVVATTDMDLGFLRVWDVCELASDRSRLQAVQRAAIAIPAAFDPVYVDGTLQADAGVLMQLICIAQPERIATYMRAWNQAHPAQPMRLRYWVVANNRTAEPPTTVQPSWHALLGRSTAMMLKSGVQAPLTALWLQTELLRRDGLDVEYRWISIPTSFPIDATIPPFDQRTTRALSDLGRSVAQEAEPWKRMPPSVIELHR